MIHEDFDDDVEHEQYDLELVQGPSLEDRAEALLCLAQRRGLNSDKDAQRESMNFAMAAADLNRDLGRPGDLFSALWSLSDAQYSLGLFDEALVTCNEGVEVALANYRETNAGGMEFNLGGIYAKLRNYEAADEHYTISANYYRLAEDRANTARSLRWNAFYKQKAGNHHSALKDISLGLEIANQDGEAWQIVEFSLLQATSCIALGDFDLAREATDRVSAGLALLPNIKIEIKNEYNKGRLLANQNKHEDAIVVFGKVIDVLKGQLYARSAAKFLFEQSKSKTALGRYAEAIVDLKVIALTYEGYADSSLALDAFVELARVQLLAGESVALEQTLTRAKRLAEQREQSGQPQLLELGQIEQQLNLSKSQPPLFDEIETGPVYLPNPENSARQN